MNITYKNDIRPSTDAIVELYKSATLNRPVGDQARIAKMYENSNLIITAWDGEQLVGISRALTDFCYCCYLSDLAVHMDYQKKGIGKRLIAVTKDAIGDEAMLLLLAAPTAMTYYPAIGMETVTNGFIIHRTV